MGKLKVAVLMGGRSEERAISLKTGTGILRALDPERYHAIALDTAGEIAPLMNGDEDSSFPASLVGGEGRADGRTADASTLLVRPQGDLLDAVLIKKDRPDVVFIALHGKYGEDGTVQGMLELIGIPYTGSGVLSSALAMNKAMSKKIFTAEGIPSPPFLHLDSPEKAPFVGDYFALPLVVKPNQQGSSVGMTIVHEKEQIVPAVETAFRYDREVVIEKFISGIEITAAVLGNKNPEVFPLVEIAPKNEFYDYDAKYTPGRTEFHIPARISEETAREARDFALRAHMALGCRGVSRVDMMVGDDGVWVLEVNTIPGMTATSLVPKAAAAAGISYSELCDRLIRLALEES